MSHRVEYAESVTLMLGRFMDDPVGLGLVMDAIDALAEHPYPESSVAWGKCHWRLHVGDYRATYEVIEEVIVVINLARRTPPSNR